MKHSAAKQLTVERQGGLEDWKEEIRYMCSYSNVRNLKKIFLKLMKKIVVYNLRRNRFASNFFVFEYYIHCTGVILLLNELSQFRIFFPFSFLLAGLVFVLYADLNYGIFTDTFFRQPYSKMYILMNFHETYVYFQLSVV